MRGHRHGRRHAAAAGRRRGRAHRPAADAGVARRAQGRAAHQGHHPRLGPRHQPGVGDPRRLRDGDGAVRRPRLRRRRPRCARVLDDDVAGIMLTNPNTLGLFEEDIVEIAAAVHEVGGLLYYDGANLNAILGVVRPGDMGFDIVHMNLHKTFAVPHGGGGPGRRSGGGVGAAGAVPARARARRAPTTARYRWVTPRAVDRAGPRLARQRPGAGPGLRLHPGQRRRRPAPGGRGGGAQRQLAPPPAAGRRTTSPTTGPTCTSSWRRRPR